MLKLKVLFLLKMASLLLIYYIQLKLIEYVFLEIELCPGYIVKMKIDNFIYKY